VQHANPAGITEPQRTLDRGYAIIRDHKGDSCVQHGVAPAQPAQHTLANGSAEASVSAVISRDQRRKTGMTARKARNAHTYQPPLHGDAGDILNHTFRALQAFAQTLTMLFYPFVVQTETTEEN
jgi:hypothetical protein